MPPIEGGVYDIALDVSVAFITTAAEAEQLYAVELSDLDALHVVGTTRLLAGGMNVAADTQYVLVGSPAARLSLWRFVFN